MADQEFNSLLQTIEQLNQKLIGTNKLLTELQASFKENPTNIGLNKVLAQTKLEAEGLTNQIKELKAEYAQQYNQQNDLARIKVIDQMRASTEALKKELSDAVAAYQKLLHEQPITGRVIQRNALSGADLTTTPNPNITTVGHPTPDKEPLINKQTIELRNLLAAEEKARIEYDQIAREVQTQQKLQQEITAKTRERFIDLAPSRSSAYVKPPAERVLTQEEEAVQQTRLNLLKQNESLYEKKNGILGRELSEDELALRTIQERVASEKKYAQALDQAAAQGFDVNNLARVNKRGNAGIEQLRFQKYDQGVLQQYDTFVNPQGRATPGISNQFRTFGQGVFRDIGEFTKWSIALAAVYGPIQKVSDLTQKMIANQTKLAEASIAVNSSFATQRDIFNTAAAAAQKAGEDVGGVIDAFTQAYRAVGGAGDQVTRYTAAQKLLNDSLTLSKLSTLDQSTAIDTLSASIRQTGGDFSNTTKLLDSWVRVTKVANVDLATLATGFATLGDAAETAGVSANDLNGILAAIAESTNQTGQEVANSARAIVSGLQSQQGQKALENLGIAATTAEGELRPLPDILREIASLTKEGVISPSQLSALSLAVGGGTRRQAVVATLFQNYDRALTVSQESARANGDAQDALAKQLETVQTALTRLENTFQELAQTMGTEGGFLQIAKDGIALLSGFVKVLDGLTAAFGRATPALAAFIAATLVLRSKGYNGIQDALFGKGQTLLADTTAIDTRLAAAGQGLSAGNPTRGQSAGNFVGQQLLGTGIAGGIFQGALLSAIPAILNATSGEKYGGARAVADIVGGVGGGVVGAMVAGSPIIGAAVGNAIAEAFVNKTIARKTDLFGYGPSTIVPQGQQQGPPTTVEEAQKRLAEAESNIYKSIGFGNESIGKILSAPLQGGGRDKAYINSINKAIADGNAETFNKLINESGGLHAKSVTGLTKQELLDVFRQGQQLQYNPQTTTFTAASAQAQAEYNKINAELKALQANSTDVTTPFGRQVQGNAAAYKAIIDTVTQQAKQELSNQRLTGQVTGSNYITQTQALGGFDTKALQYYTALGDTFIKMNGGIKDSTDAFRAFSTVVTKGSQESTQQITQIVGEISTLINQLNDPVLKQDAIKQYGSENAAKQRLAELQKTGATLLSDVYQQARLGSLNIPQIQGDVTKPYTSQDIATITQRYNTLETQFYKKDQKLPDDLLQSLKQSFDTFATPVQDFGDAVAHFKDITEKDPQLWKAAIDQLIKEGKLSSQDTGFGLAQYNVNRATLESLATQSLNLGNKWQQQFPGFQSKQEDLLAITNDNIAKPIHADFRILAILLQQLNDKAQKQLDGQYNIPEGATFWVPLTAAYYRPQNQGTGDLSGLDTTGLDSSANNLDEAANALKDAANSLTVANGRPPRENIGTYRQNHPGEAPPYATPTLSQVYQQTVANRNSAEVPAYAPFTSPGSQNKLNDQLATPESTSTANQLQSFVSQLLEGMRSIFTQSLNQTFDPTVPHGAGINGFGSGIPAQSQSQSNTQPINAKVDFKFNSTTQLMVDGRILASIVTPYLASDLLQLQTASNTTTKQYII